MVEAAGQLDSAFEIGANAGVSFPGVFGRADRLSLSAQVRWDVAGAHDGMLTEPQLGYFPPVGRAASVQIAASASATQIGAISRMRVLLCSDAWVILPSLSSARGVPISWG